MKKTTFLIAAAMLSLGSATAFAANTANGNVQTSNMVAQNQAAQAPTAAANQATMPSSQNGPTVIWQTNPNAPLQTLGG